MEQIYDRLQKLGYSREFLRRVMPDWWTDETDADPDCVLEGAMFLATRLGLSIHALLAPQSPRSGLLRRDYWAQLPREGDRDN